MVCFRIFLTQLEIKERTLISKKKMKFPTILFSLSLDDDFLLDAQVADLKFVSHFFSENFFFQILYFNVLIVWCVV